MLAGVPRVVVTDVDGSYAFEALPPGAYTITFTLPGFEELARTVELAAASAPTVDVSLRVGGLFEEVTVTVTGTAIDAPAINMPHAVVVVSRDTIEQQGSTRYCQVEAFRADPTPRYWQRRALKPHHLVARFELETST